MPHQSLKSKIMGTAAISVFLSLPRDVQAQLYDWAHRNENFPDRLDPREGFALLLAMLKRVDSADLPPTESKGGKLVRVIEPPVQREGYTEQVIRELEVAPPKPEEGGPRRAVEGG